MRRWYADKNPEPGGTWWQNTYPGCRVDTPSLLYSFSFDQDPGWPEHFSHQPELLAYLKRSVEHNGLAHRLRCGVEVAAMGWDEDAARGDAGVDLPGKRVATIGTKAPT